MQRLRARWLLALVLIVAGVALGAAGGFVFSTFQKDVYRANVALIAQTGSQPVTGGVLHTIKDLVKTDIVAQNVIRNQQLRETTPQFFDRLHVSSVGSVITVGVDDQDENEAVRMAQELSLVFTQLVRDRFGSTASSAQVSIFDPAHSVGRVSPHIDRDIGWGALFGGLLGLLAANVFVLRGRRSVWSPIPIAYDALPALGAGPPAALPPAPARVIGLEGGEIADALIERASVDPFQTVLVAGDADSTLTPAIAHALAERDELTMWVRAGDADAHELDRLSARCAFVLVASPAFDSSIAERVDAVLSVANGGVTLTR